MSIFYFLDNKSIISPDRPNFLQMRPARSQKWVKAKENHQKEPTPTKMRPARSQEWAKAKENHQIDPTPTLMRAARMQEWVKEFYAADRHKSPHAPFPSSHRLSLPLPR